jgi:hypothetical protein
MAKKKKDNAIDATDVPVHWLVSVDDKESRMVQTACGRHTWELPFKTILDPNRKAINPVTCPECLKAIAEKLNATEGKK